MADIVWWEVETPAPEAFMTFHRALWGWEFTQAFQQSEFDADYWLIKSDGRGIGGLQRAAANSAPAVGTRVYFEVENLENFLVRVRELGGRVDRDRTELGGDDKWFATFRDTTGVSFGLWTAHAR